FRYFQEATHTQVTSTLLPSPKSAENWSETTHSCFLLFDPSMPSRDQTKPRLIPLEAHAWDGCATRPAPVLTRPHPVMGRDGPARQNVDDVGVSSVHSSQPFHVSCGRNLVIRGIQVVEPSRYSRVQQPACYSMEEQCCSLRKKFQS
ncbi:unnamed protein product, partial [Ectocarpus sp. 6 AP-2014]